MENRFISLILFLLVSLSVRAQLPVIQLPQVTTGSGRWWPTNAPGMFLWLETVPFMSSSNNADNGQVRMWTNLVNTANSPTADQSLNPTNFISGGGKSGTAPRVHWGEATGGSQRLITGNICPANATFIFVANCDDAATSPGGLFYSGSSMHLQFHSGALQFSEGTTVTGPATIGTGYYIITTVFNGASSEIDTNGVLYVSGDVGNTLPLAAVYLGQFQAFKGNISRVWAWTNTLSAGNLSSAITQCKTDYGF